MDAYAKDLLDAVEAAVPAWVERCVTRVLDAQRLPVSDDVRAAARRAGQAARASVVADLEALLSTDVDVQRTNPLSVLRGAVRFPTAVLEEAGARPVPRGQFEAGAFPEDVYDLSPASWRDVDDSLHEPGIVWGAWKAKTVLDRRRAERDR